MSIGNSNWFIFRTNEYYYPQGFWKECNYYIKDRKIHNYIADDSDEDILDKIQIKKNSDEEDSNEEEHSDEKKNITKNYLTIEEIII